MQILIDGPEAQRDLLKIRTYAINNICDLTNGIPENHMPCGDNPNHVFINGTLKIVYSIERQKILHKTENRSEIVLLHHLSVSNANGKLPNEIIFEAILKMFNMASLKNKDKIREVWLEDEHAVNVVEVMDIKESFKLKFI